MSRQRFCKRGHDTLVVGRYRNSTCKGCAIEKSHQVRREGTEFLWKLKDKPCTDCKGTFHPWQMEWDHLPGTIKKYNVSCMHFNIGAMLKEIEKCELVCANCHKNRTYLRNRGN